MTWSAWGARRRPAHPTGMLFIGTKRPWPGTSLPPGSSRRHALPMPRTVAGNDITKRWRGWLLNFKASLRRRANSWDPTTQSEVLDAGVRGQSGRGRQARAPDVASNLQRWKASCRFRGAIMCAVGSRIPSGAAQGRASVRCRCHRRASGDAAILRLRGLAGHAGHRCSQRERDVYAQRVSGERPALPQPPAVVHRAAGECPARTRFSGEPAALPQPAGGVRASGVLARVPRGAPVPAQVSWGRMLTTHRLALEPPPSSPGRRALAGRRIRARRAKGGWPASPHSLGPRTPQGALPTRTTRSPRSCISPPCPTCTASR